MPGIFLKSNTIHKGDTELSISETFIQLLRHVECSTERHWYEQAEMLV